MGNDDIGGKKMLLKKIKKQICAALVATVTGISLSLTAAPMPSASAMGLGDIVGIGVGVAQIAQQKEELRKYCNYLNSNEEGREALYQELQKQCGVNDDVELNQKLDRIMSNLSSAVAEVDPTINDKPYKYFVSQDGSINAACAMGHVMMVNTGTFSYIPNEDEIAAIVGHEMGHGQKDHVIKSQTSNFDKALLANIAVAAAGGSVLTNLVGNLALKHSIVHGDKRHEWEADGLAFEYMTHTNYNPGACAAVMQRFMELLGSQKQDFAGNLLNPSDHPNTEARRDKYIKQLYEYSGNHVTMKDGTVIVNGEKFVTPAPADGMSGIERSCFVLGNLAAAYNHGHGTADAHVENGALMLGPQVIMIPANGDEAAEVLAERLNSVKDLQVKAAKDKKKG